MFQHRSSLHLIRFAQCSRMLRCYCVEVTLVFAAVEVAVLSLLELDVADWDAEEVAELTDFGILGVGFWMIRSRILDAGRVTDFGREEVPAGLD